MRGCVDHEALHPGDVIVTDDAARDRVELAGVGEAHVDVDAVAVDRAHEQLGRLEVGESQRGVEVGVAHRLADGGDRRAEDVAGGELHRGRGLGGAFARMRS